MSETKITVTDWEKIFATYATAKRCYPQYVNILINGNWNKSKGNKTQEAKRKYMQMNEHFIKG